MEKIKQYLNFIFAGLAGILTLAFLYEKNKAESAGAIADNKETLDKVNDLNKQIAENNGQIASEEEKRTELQKENNNAKSNDSDDPSDFFKKR